MLVEPVKKTKMRAKLPSFGLAIVLLLSCMARAHASFPDGDKGLDLVIRNQSLSDFLEVVFSQTETPLIQHGDIKGVVSGHFVGRAEDVWSRIGSEYNLVLYFDGVVGHVYPANSLVRKAISLDVSLITELRRLINEVGFGDEANRVDPISGGIIITGVPRFVQQVEGLLDIATRKQPVVRRRSNAAGTVGDDYAYRVFRLNHAWAADTTHRVGSRTVTVPGVANLLRKLIVSDSSSAAPVAQRYGSANAMQAVNEEFPTPTVSQLPNTINSNTATVRSASARVVADRRINAVIVSDSKDRLPAYESLIRSLDMPSEMVEIEATVIDINSDKSREIGFNWELTAENAVGRFVTDADSPLTRPDAGGIVTAALNNRAEFIARIQALEREGSARIVSKPHVATLSNIEAVLSTTDEFFVRVAGDSMANLYNVEVGTSLRVRPHVFYQGTARRIRLGIVIEDGTWSSSGDTVDEIPVISRSAVSTQAVVNEGSSILVGGLKAESAGTIESRVPLLSKLPVIGGAFRSSSVVSSSVERLFLITPRLTRLEATSLVNKRDVTTGTATQQNNSSSSTVRRATSKPFVSPFSIKQWQ